jgi:hypothetical protein
MKQRIPEGMPESDPGVPPASWAVATEFLI